MIGHGLPGNKKDDGWIKMVKEGGIVPLLEADNCPNSSVTLPETFSDNCLWLADFTKIVCGEYLLKPLSFD